MRCLLLLLTLLFLAGCGSSGTYRYRYVPGKTAILHRNGQAEAPAHAPPAVHRMIEAGNRIAGLPYRRGGGHGKKGIDSAYDCSGAVSYVLREGGVLKGSRPSVAFRHYGEPGPGKWVSVYARKDHVFLVVAGLRFDTGWTRHPEGPRWTTASRPFKGVAIRHPAGL